MKFQSLRNESGGECDYDDGDGGEIQRSPLRRQLLIGSKLISSEGRDHSSSSLFCSTLCGVERERERERFC